MNKFKWKNPLHICILLVLSFCIIFNFSTPKINYEVNKVNTKEKVIMITFDDGPSLADETILDILKENNAKATFFGTGINYEKYWKDEKVKAITDRMVNEGHTLGNHSYYHNKYQFKTKSAYDEFYKTSDMIVKIYAENNIPKTISDVPIRMPFLQYYRGMDYLQSKMQVEYFVRGYLGCDYDEAICGKEKILKQYKSNIRPGQILVCHTRDYAKEWLPDLLKHLNEKNYKTVNFTNGDQDYRNYGGLIF
ncbi:polysaccharide deacetylase family protein [Spiroplasma cantharicola]|uniref:Putative chitin deacetylase n=1 Tax=Spiroplasma cantharicola TaxID=362837 RepID=A0A0M4JSN3_9MOLU|nr:polysaccharide deacetylase family protein [Spiroplasma cantharicola]ALD66421.1 putative chitin deacetylase [Spiroplasma cantharicola]